MDPFATRLKDVAKPEMPMKSCVGGMARSEQRARDSTPSVNTAIGARLAVGTTRAASALTLLCVRRVGRGPESVPTACPALFLTAIAV